MDPSLSLAVNTDCARGGTLLCLAGLDPTKKSHSSFVEQL